MSSFDGVQCLKVFFLIVNHISIMGMDIDSIRSMSPVKEHGRLSHLVVFFAVVPPRIRVIRKWYSIKVPSLSPILVV